MDRSMSALRGSTWEFTLGLQLKPFSYIIIEGGEGRHGAKGLQTYPRPALIASLPPLVKAASAQGSEGFKQLRCVDKARSTAAKVQCEARWKW